MQFLQPTFASIIAEHPIPPGGSQPPSRYDPHDAIHAAAYYLCDSGARNGDLHAAIFAYNHADWYVNKVLAQAERYRAAASTPPASAGGWVLPVAGRCSSGFGLRDGQFHQGQDLAAPIGTPIVAAADGTVLNADPQRLRPVGPHPAPRRHDQRLRPHQHQPRHRRPTRHPRPAHR